MCIPLVHLLCLLSAVFENPPKRSINAMVVLSKNRTHVYEEYFGSTKNDGKLASDVGEQVLSQFIHDAINDVIESLNHAKRESPSNDVGDGDLLLARNRTVVYEAFFSSTENDSKVASKVGKRVLSQFTHATSKDVVESLNHAKGETPSNDGDDPILKRMDAVIELFAKGRKDQEEFLTACEKSFPELEKLIEKLKSIPTSFERIHSRWSKIKIITGIVGILSAIALAIACPPLAAVAAVAVTGLAVVGTTCLESLLLKNKQKQASELVENIQSKFEIMAEWLEFPKKLKATFEEMMDPKILTEVNKDVEIFFKNFFKQDNLTVDKKKKQLKGKIGKWVKWMSMDQKISGLDDEMRAIVMTFLLVSLIKSSNQFVLVSARQTLNKVLGKFDGMDTGDSAVSEFMVLAKGSMVQQEKIGDCLKKIFVPIVHIVKLIVNSSLDAKYSEIAEEINKVVPAFETSFSFLKDTCECLKEIKYTHEADVIEWVNVLVLGVPGNAEQVDIRGAVRLYLPKEAHGCVKLEKLKTEGNNWYVQVPKKHSAQLLKQSSIQIKNQSCVVTK